MARPKTNILPSIPASSRMTEVIRAAEVHGEIEVKGVGVFEIVEIPQKKLYHNFSKRTRIVKAYKKLKFTQSPTLKKTLTEAFASY